MKKEGGSRREEREVCEWSRARLHRTKTPKNQQRPSQLEDLSMRRVKTKIAKRAPEKNSQTGQDHSGTLSSLFES